jgi:hypothetical protein
VAIPLTQARRLPGANVAVAAVAVTVGLVGYATARSTAIAADIGGLVRAAPYLLLAALVIPGLLAIARRPQRGVLALTLLIPFSGLLIIAPGKPPFAEGWKEALALYTLAWSFLSTWDKPRVKHPAPRLVQPLAVYFGVAAASALLVGGTQGLVGLKIGFFWVVMGLTVWRTPLDARDRDRLVSLLMIGGLLTAVYGLAQQKIGDVGLANLGYAYNTNIRYTGSFVRSFSSFPNPFAFASFLTFVLIICVPVCLEEIKRYRNFIFLLLTPVLLAALVFTFVRGAWLALGLGMLYLALRKYRVLLLPVPFALLALAVLPGSFSTSAFESTSFGERQVGWSQNISKVVSAPFGNGIGTTGASAEKTVIVTHDVSRRVYQPDNQYFKVLYELGVIGLWIFVLLYAALLVTARRVESELTGTDRAMAMGVTGLVIGAIAASFVATWLEIFPNDLYLWTMLAVVLTATHESS